MSSDLTHGLKQYLIGSLTREALSISATADTRKFFLTLTFKELKEWVFWRVGHIGEVWQSYGAL